MHILLLRPGGRCQHTDKPNQSSNDVETGRFILLLCTPGPSLCQISNRDSHSASRRPALSLGALWRQSVYSRAFPTSRAVSKVIRCYEKIRRPRNRSDLYFDSYPTNKTHLATTFHVVLEGGMLYEAQPHLMVGSVVLCILPEIPVLSIRCLSVQSEMRRTWEVNGRL